MPGNRLRSPILFLLLALCVRAQDSTPAIEEAGAEYQRETGLGLLSAGAEYRKETGLGLLATGAEYRKETGLALLLAGAEYRREAGLGLLHVTAEYTLAPVVASLGPENPSGGAVETPASDVSLLQLRIRRNGGSGTLHVQSVRLVAQGNAEPNNVRLVQDGGVLASGVFDITRSLTFAGLDIAVEPASSVDLWVVADLGFANGQTLAIVVDQVEATDPVAGLPITAATFTLQGGDSAAPEITVTNPVNQQVYNNQTSVTLAFSAQDPSGIASLSGTLDGTPVTNDQTVELCYGAHRLTISIRSMPSCVRASRE